MKKFAKLSAVLAAMVIALAFAGCSSDDDDDDDDGMQAVTDTDTGASGTDASSMKDIDASEIGAGTYKYTSTYKSVCEGQSYISVEEGTVEISADKSSVTEIEKSFKEIYSDEQSYNDGKKEWGTEGENEYCTVRFDDAVYTITVTYKNKDKNNEETFSFADFKEDYFTLPESSDNFDHSESYYGWSLKMSKDGARIETSYKSTWREKIESKRQGTSEYRYVLVRQ